MLGQISRCDNRRTTYVLQRNIQMVTVGLVWDQCCREIKEPVFSTVPSEHKNDGRTADICRGRYFDRPQPSSTVPGRHRAVTVYT